MNTTPPDMDRSSFLTMFGAVYEHSPWIAEAVYDQARGGLPDEPDGLNEQFKAVIMAAGVGRQIALLRAHPELGVGQAEGDELTQASRKEQASAGLDRCTDEEYEAFKNLNTRYLKKFGFPFIMQC